MADEVTIEVVTPGGADDPFSAATSAQTQTASDPGVVASQAAEGQPGAAPVAPAATDPVTDPPAAQPAATAAESDDEPLTAEEQAALDVYFQTRAETELLPRLQSSFDRREAQTRAELQRIATAAAARETELLATVREAKLVGLTDDEKARLQTQWSIEDEKAKLQSYEQQLEGYHKDILTSSYVVQYPHLELEAEDFADFSTPEQMEMFVAIADREYWKAMAQQRGPQATAGAPGAPAPQPKIDTVPAGATAPSDATGGGAPPPTPRVNTGTGQTAIADNIGSGWETVRIAR